MPYAVLEDQEFWQDAAFLSWRSLRDWARLAQSDKMWRWWSREFTPWLCLTVLPLQSANPNFLPGLPHLFLLQKKAKPGTLAQVDNKQLSEVFDLSLNAKTLGNELLLLLCISLSHNINSLSRKQIAWSSSWSQALHAPSWWHNVCLSGQAIVHSAATHGARTVSSHMALFDKGHKHS